MEEKLISANIYQRLLRAQMEMETVSKNLIVETGKTTKPYKAAGERDVLDAVKKVEGKYGIYSYPYSREIVESDQLESENQYGKRTTFYLRVKTVYRFVNVDKPEEYIEVIGYGDGMDSGDKATGKCLTYCDKYCLMKAYKISTGDDPDQDASVDASYSRKNSAYKGRTDFTKPVQDNSALVREVEEFCMTAGLPYEWLADKYSKKSLNDMSEKELLHALSKKTAIIEAYEGEKK